MADKSIRRWYHWYSPDDTPEERKLILKLDLLIVPYAFIIYWVKYIDQTNINNAYVSGMSEELGFTGNQLVQFQTIFMVGNTVGLIPFAYIFPNVPMHFLVPSLDLGWGLFTLLQYRAQSFGEIAAYRFLVAMFEASYFPGVHYVLGSWYRGDEISRRGGVFYVGLTLGTLTASLSQSAASSNLDGVNGLAGWRWSFIINAITTLPLAILGYLIWPGTPARPNRIFLSERELQLARDRLEKHGAKPNHRPFTLKRLVRMFSSSRIWVLIVWTTIFFNTSANTAAMLLWLKSLKRYPVPVMNQYNTIPPALGIFYVLFFNFSADLGLGRAMAITLASLLNISGLLILTIWDVPESAKWYAFATTYSGVAVSSTLYGWANSILRFDIEERAVALIAMTTIATSTSAWIPLFTWPTVEAPRFPKGYPYALAASILQIAMTWFIKYWFGEDGSKHAPVTEEGVDRIEDNDLQPDSSILEDPSPSKTGIGPKVITAISSQAR